MASQTTKWILELVDGVTSPMGDITDSASKGKDKVDDLGKSLKDMSAIDLSAIANSIGQIKGMLNDFSKPGIAFDSAMKEMQSITLLADEENKKLGKAARKQAKQYGVDASSMIGSYTGIISRFGQEIAKSDEGVAAMGDNVAVLSKLMKGDASGAMDALTTAMLQFDVSLDDPISAAMEMTSMMHVMVAAGNAGASEVSNTAEALKVAGVQAKNANVTFEETNAALQALAKGGLYGSEAGMKMRNVFAKLSGEDLIPRDAAEKLRLLGVNFDIVSDKTRPFTERLRELKKAQGDATVMAQVFGIQNEAAAQILLNNIDYVDEMTSKITGTTEAYASAEIVMSSYTERMARMSAWFQDLGISIFGATQYVLPFITAIAGSVMVMANLANARTGVVLLMTTLKTMPVVGSVVNGAFNLMALGAKGLGVAISSIPIIGWIAAVVSGLVVLGTYFWNTSAEFRSVLMGVWEFVKVYFTGFYKFIWEVMQGIWHVIKGVFDPRNWFDKNYKFSDGFKQITDAATEYGEALGKAFSEGREKGLESFYDDNPDKRPQAKTNSSNSATNLNKTVSPVISTSSIAAGKGATGTGLSGSGGTSGVKNITQNIEMKNYFNVDGNTNVESIAERVISAINNKMRDSIIIAG